MFMQEVTVMNDCEMILKMLKDGKGFITASEVTAAGIQRRALGELVTTKWAVLQI